MKKAKKQENIQPDIAPLDLTQKREVVREKWDLTDIVLEKFQQAFRADLSRYLGKICHFSHKSTEFIPYEEFIEGLPLHSFIGVLGQRGPLSSVLVILENKLCFGLIELLMGGKGGEEGRQQESEGDPERDYSKIEISFLRNILDLVALDLSRAWSSIYPLELKFKKVETNPHWVGAAFPTEPMMVATFTMGYDAVKGTIHLALPCSSIDLIRKKISERKGAKGLGQDIPVDMSSQMAGTTLTLADLLQWKKGDIILLDEKVPGEITLEVDGVPLFKGVWGKSQEKNSVTITRRIPKSAK